MLRSLRVENFGLFRMVELDLDSGFIAITGESGTGKSLAMEAIQAGLGTRLPSERIGPFAESTRIRLVFELPEDHAVWDYLSGWGIESDSHLVVQRDHGSDGRSVFRVQGQVVPAQAVKTMRPWLIEFSGQHQSLRLLQAQEFLDWLDRYGQLTAFRGRVADAHRRWTEARRELQSLMDSRLSEDTIQEYREALQEIQAVQLEPEADQKIQEELIRVRFGKKLWEGYGQVRELLERTSPPGILDQIYQALHILEGLAKIDSGIAPALGILRESGESLEDVRLQLGKWSESLDLDPVAVAELEERGDQIARLKRKFGPELSDVSRYRDELQNKLAAMDNLDWEIGRQQQAVNRTQQELAGLSQQLSEARKEAAGRASAELTRLIREMEMPTGTIELRLEAHDISASGQDAVGVLFSASRGQPATLLAKAASGGELARVALAMAVMVGDQQGVSLVFDELDAGLGGVGANRVGLLLHELGQQAQVLVISHQPAVASRATQHFVVQKHVRDKVTESTIVPVRDADREVEVARMLSGSGKDVALRHARQLLSEGDVSV